MSGFVIAIANMKGGVGKTATTLSLAEGMAASGSRVLVIDLDAQTNASFCIAGNELLMKLIEEGQTVTARFDDALLREDDQPVQNYIKENATSVTHMGEPLPLDLLASGTELRELEREVIYTLTERKQSLKRIEGQVRKILNKDLNYARKHYDYIIIDCAPGISTFTEVAVKLCDLVIVPTIPDFISTLGVEAFSHTVLETKTTADAKKKGSIKPYVLATKVRGTPHHRNTVEDLRSMARSPKHNFKMFNTTVGETVSVPGALEQVDVAQTYAQKWGKVIPTVEALIAEIEVINNGS